MSVLRPSPFSRLPKEFFRTSFRSISTTPDVKLFQYEICPFCCKVKTFLDWKKVPYSTLDVNPLNKMEISFSKDYKKVPIALIDGEQVNDSPVILNKLLQSLQVSPTEEDQKWIQWADKKLAVLLFPNLTRSFKESWEAFNYINKVPHFSKGQKLVNRSLGGLAMWLANGKIKKKHNITDERKALLECLQEWEQAVTSKGGKFHGGSEPDLSDVVVMGVLRSVRDFQTHQWIMANSGIAPWYDGMEKVLGPAGSSRQARTFQVPEAEKKRAAGGA